MSEPDRLSRSARFDASEDVGSNPTGNPTMGDVIAARLSRRDVVRGALAASAIALAVAPVALAAAGKARAQGGTPSFNFKEVAAGSDENIHVAEGYDADVLIRWGDKVAADAPAFDPAKQTAAAQARQFGYNNDFLGYVPLEGSRRGLLVVNHEYTNEELMFPHIGRQDGAKKFADMTKDLVDIEMAAHGGTVIEIARGADGKWRVVPDSKYARRITASTEIAISGPAAGHARMKTKADPTGTKVLGMLNNCAGGVTPWGTWLTCEENFHGYF
ncbi:MAG TPA: alkaline phosphatase PhoX, partial [Hyphomicrobiaceae bacterium]|nr:alkaline phosphatase PhoX [Hyphomicrobiaceae bacterium]